MLTNGGEQKTYKEAMFDQHRDKWLQAMQSELNCLHKIRHELVKLPKGKRAPKNKQALKIKLNENLSQFKYKVRLIVKGFHQKKGIDFGEVFSLMVKMSSIEVVLRLVAS